MDQERRDLALRALSLLHGDAPDAGHLDLTQVAEGQAYLNGFVIEMLAEAMNISEQEAVDRIRQLLDGGGDESGDREPRRPNPSPPALAVERDE